MEVVQLLQPIAREYVYGCAFIQQILTQLFYDTDITLHSKKGFSWEITAKLPTVLSILLAHNC